ncbi:MAG: hypothetical protein WA434_16590 [Candidatus Acidiferrales bacterium]
MKKFGSKASRWTTLISMALVLVAVPAAMGQTTAADQNSSKDTTAKTSRKKSKKQKAGTDQTQAPDTTEKKSHRSKRGKASDNASATTDQLLSPDQCQRRFSPLAAIHQHSLSPVSELS